MSAARESFACFGSTCAIWVDGEGPTRSATEAAAIARGELEAWHARFSRFIPSSELSRVNRDARERVAVSPMMGLLASAVRRAGDLTGGLVDATQLEEIERAGYTADLGEPLPLAAALARAPERRAGSADPRARWRLLEVDLARRTLTRPAGVMLDSGGLAKGLFADVLAARLAAHASFAISCGGDAMLGGSAGTTRPVEVESPFDGSILHTFELRRAGVATSGIGRRSWIASDGSAAHHLLDPATARPAFTGIVQATAIAPSALLAEIYAKAALLAGPRAARLWLPHGGLVVLDDESHVLIEPPQRISLPSFQLAPSSR